MAIKSFCMVLGIAIDQSAQLLVIAMRSGPWYETMVHNL